MSVPSLSVCTACKGRLDFLKATYPGNVELLQESGLDVTFHLLDYDCPQGTWKWAAEFFGDRPNLNLLRLAEPRPIWAYGIAQNTVMFSARGDWLLNLLADVHLQPPFVETLNAGMETADLIHRPYFGGASGVVAVKRDFFADVLNGYDERFADYGRDKHNLILRARMANARIGFWNLEDISWIDHSDELRMQFARSDKTLEESKATNRRLRIRGPRANPRGRQSLKTVRVSASSSFATARGRSE